MIYPYIVQFILAAIASMGFSILFNCPKEELIPTGVCGGVAWIIYSFVFKTTINELLGVFLASVAVAVLSRLYSYKHMAPSTIFLIPGIIPLVPGSLTYTTMKGMLESDVYYTFVEATKAIKFAGVIAVGIVLVFTLPYSAFAIGKQKKVKR